MKYLKMLFILLLVFLCGCAKDAPAAENTTIPETTEKPGVCLEIIDKNPGRVLKEEYKLEQIRAAFGAAELSYDHNIQDLALDITLADLHEVLPIACLKEDYAIYAVQEGGYYYVFWNAPGTHKTGDMLELSTAKPVRCLYVPRVCTEEDFNSVVMGVTTAKDVLKIDPTVCVDYGKDDFGGGSSRGHDAYCFATLENGEYFFIGFDGDFDDKAALIATEMEIVGQDQACMVWSLDIEKKDWPEQKEEAVEYSTYEDFLEQIENPIDGTGMLPLVFVDTAEDARVGYLICAGNNGQAYIADRFIFNGKSLYRVSDPQYHGVDYQKGPYSTGILDINKQLVFRDFKGNSVSAKIQQLTGEYINIITFLQLRPRLDKALPTDSRFWFATYEGVEMFPEDSVYTENGFSMDLDGDGTTDQVEITLTEVPDSYTEDKFVGYTGYYYDYEINIRRNGRTFRFKPFAEWVQVAPDDLAVFAADVDLDGEYEIIEFMIYHKRFGGITIYDFNGATYDELYYSISPQN